MGEQDIVATLFEIKNALTKSATFIIKGLFMKIFVIRRTKKSYLK